MHLPENLQEWLVIAWFGIFLAFFLFQIFRRGGVRGAFLNGTIKETIGEVTIRGTGSMPMTQTFRVHVIDRDGEGLVAVELVSKSLLSAEMLPIVMSKAQAKKLQSLLDQAAGDDEF